MNFGTLGDSIGRFVEQTHLVEQGKAADFAALFTNPWFLVPFIALIGYQLYKKAFRDMIILAILMGAWYASGTPYMQGMVIDGQLQINKILPVTFGGAAMLGLIVYLILGRSD